MTTDAYPYAVTDDTGHETGYRALVDAMKAAALRWREGKPGVVVHDRVRDVRWRPGEGRR